ncbi:MAG TPA: glycoside hydrolase family 36 protein [Candidatus Saccharimonadales bacterium]|nr:glycoside hydrolase family 36 protein [Candidatus Saccharimonadales bacterium]
MKQSTVQLRTNDDLLDVVDAQGTSLLEGCFGGLQLSSGVALSMEFMPRVCQVADEAVTIIAGGDEILPRLILHARQIRPGMVEATLAVENTTQTPLRVERLDVLASKKGYRQIPTDKLFLYSNGWQTFSPAALRVPFDTVDPWLQPPLFTPLPTSSLDTGRHLSWVTLLQADDTPSLLAGFASARDYLGMLHVQRSSQGHQLTASNYVEGLTVEPGATLQSEPLVLMWGVADHELLDAYGAHVGQVMQARIPERPPTGWSNWLYYFATASEQDILENTAIIQEKDLPLEYIQVDDCYQTLFGDWLSINDKFPNGMRSVADAIKAAGRKPGIWLSPFMADARSRVVAEHPEWFLHDASGHLIDVNRFGDTYWAAPNYGLDVTHPEAMAWLRTVLTTLCEEWGYEYIKTDFLYAGAIQAVRYDAACTSVQAYRKGLAAIREIAGDRIVLGCGAPFLCSVGLVDTMRIGPDLSWEADLPGAIQPKKYALPFSRVPLMSMLGHQWMNRNLWINDADYVRVRQQKINLDWPQTRALTALIALGGGSMYDSDKLADLEPEGYELLNRLVPVANVRVRPVGERQNKPSRLLAAVDRLDGSWYIGSQFNWSEAILQGAFEPQAWELPAGEYHVYDLLHERYVGLHASYELGELAQYNAHLFSACLTTDRPQVIATKGHLLGPAGDVAAVSWENNELHVELTAGRRTQTVVYVHVPEGYTVTGLEGGTKQVLADDIVAIAVTGTQCALQFA